MSWTDDELKKLEKTLHDMYGEAGKGLVQKAKEFLADLQRKDEWRRRQVADGEWTEEQYKEWRKNKLLYAAKFKRLTETVQREMLEVNKKAIEILNGETPKIFAHNYNSVVEAFPDSPVEGYTFELVDAETVKKLATSGELMLPPKKKFDPEKDKAWNGKQLNAQILQGILQGESIPKIAARMADVCDGNEKAMVRTARTLVTAAENSGRIAGMNKAEESGIIFDKVWISASDSRTRDTHAALNGTKVGNGEMFKTFLGNELEFPGDWRAPGYEVYNCRCTLGTEIKGFGKVKLNDDAKSQSRFGAKPTEEEKSMQSGEKEIRSGFKETTTGVPGTALVEKPKTIAPLITQVIRSMKKNSVEYKPMAYFDVQPTEKEIINSLMGGDMTERGACASLALAYIGQTLGINVLDFRGGKSNEYFGTPENFNAISKLSGIVAYRKNGNSSKEQAVSLLNECESGKIYLLAIAEHSAMIRKNEDGIIEYLELQSKFKNNNGWKKLTERKLKKRFDVTADKVTYDRLMNNFMINVTDSNFGDDFKYMLGYINTAEADQQKGARGGRK